MGGERGGGSKLSAGLMGPSRREGRKWLPGSSLDFKNCAAAVYVSVTCCMSLSKSGLLKCWCPQGSPILSMRLLCQVKLFDQPHISSVCFQ